MNATQRWISISFVLGICAAYALWGRPAGAPGTPPRPPAVHAAVSALKLDPPSIDFGEVYVGENHPVTVTVLNPTDRKISVTAIKRSCGCLGSGMAHQEVEPGKSQPLSLTLTGTGGVRTDHQTLTMITDEPGKPAVELPVHYKIMEVFKVEPSVLYFGKVPRGISKTLEVRVTRADGKPFTIRQVAAGHAEFGFVTRPVPDTNQSAYAIEVTARGEAPQRIDDSAAILTDHPRVPSVPLILSLEVGGDVVSSKVLLIGEVGIDGKVRGLETELKRISPGKLSLEKITDSAGQPMDFTIDNVTENSCHIILKFSKADAIRAQHGEIWIKTNVEKEPLRLNYSIQQ